MCQIEACLHDMVDTEAASHNKRGLPNANCNGSTVAHLLGKSLIEFEGNKSKSINDVGEEEVVVEGSGMGKRSNEGSCLENATVNELNPGRKTWFLCILGEFSRI
ncbi:unnamed protein product [Lathyrus oleraceus]